MCVKDFASTKPTTALSVTIFSVFQTFVFFDVTLSSICPDPLRWEAAEQVNTPSDLNRPTSDADVVKIFALFWIEQGNANCTCTSAQQWSTTTQKPTADTETPDSLINYIFNKAFFILFIMIIASPSYFEVFINLFLA